MTKDLGFGKSHSAPREALDLSDLPTASSAPSDSRTTEKFFESAAERIGFKSREPTERVTRQRSKSKEAMDQVYLRAPISVVNRFKEHCNEKNISYGQALEALMDKAGI